MIAPRLLIATACSMAVVGAAGVAWAQTSSPSTSDQTQGQTQSQNSSQMQGQTPGTTSNSTAPGSMNSTTEQPSGSTMDTERAARADRN